MKIDDERHQIGCSAATFVAGIFVEFAREGFQARARRKSPAMSRRAGVPSGRGPANSRIVRPGTKFVQASVPQTPPCEVLGLAVLIQGVCPHTPRVTVPRHASFVTTVISRPRRGRGTDRATADPIVATIGEHQTATDDERR